MSTDAVVGDLILISILFIPVIGGVASLILRGYRGSVSLWHWNTVRPLWSCAWTIGAAWLAYVSFDIFHNHGFSGCGWLNPILWGEFLYTLLVLRAVLVARPRQRVQPRSYFLRLYKCNGR